MKKVQNEMRDIGGIENDNDIGDLSEALSKSPTSVNVNGGRKFDAEKVARIKAQIENGEYKIDPTRIVSRMIENNT